MSAADKQLVNITSEVTSLTNPKGMVDFASTLKGVIVEQGLYTNIKGKNYVHVEAWQFAGAAMGVIAIVKSTERVGNDPQEMKYRAEVELRKLDNDQLVGSGIAFCSKDEYSKKSFDEYAIASMAQTRATSKAYRIAFGWLMKMAGYEATPHEEMDGVGDKDDFNSANQRVTEKIRKVEHDMIDSHSIPKTNNVADNAKFMNTKPSDIAPDFIPEFPALEREYAEIEFTGDDLKRAKEQINVMLEDKGHTNNMKKLTFIHGVLKKKTIDTLDDATKVADALEEGN